MTTTDTALSRARVSLSRFTRRHSCASHRGVSKAARLQRRTSSWWYARSCASACRRGTPSSPAVIAQRTAWCYRMPCGAAGWVPSRDSDAMGRAALLASSCATRALSTLFSRRNLHRTDPVHVSTPTPAPIPAPASSGGVVDQSQSLRAPSRRWWAAPHGHQWKLPRYKDWLRLPPPVQSSPRLCRPALGLHRYLKGLAPAPRPTSTTTLSLSS
jgi:hypothetical protein